MRVFLYVIPVFWLAAAAAADAAALHDAAKAGDLTAIAAALDGGADVNEADGGATPLYFAVRRNKPDAARLLIERGADVNAVASLGPALFAAVAKSRIELIRLLLEKGADPNIAFDGNTALHIAAEKLCIACLTALVESGADVNAKDVYGAPPLHLARRYGNREGADYLLEHGVDIPTSPPISDKLAAADADSGRSVFEESCQNCHTAQAGNSLKEGVSLWGIVGRDKASLADFAYSDVLNAWEGSWTYDDLNSFLAAPMARAPGVKMEVPGIPDEGLRVNLIAFLRTLSDNPMPLP